VSEKKKRRLELQGRMIDLGHTPKEKVVNHILNKVEKSEKHPTDAELHEMISDADTRENIQNIYI
jgi:hypothetical protein